MMIGTGNCSKSNTPTMLLLQNQERKQKMKDPISRQAAIDAVRKCSVKEVTSAYMLIGKAEAMTELMLLPSAQPEIIQCKDCIYYDPKHIENNGIRYEYKDMPKEAFDELETGLVYIEYGINVGGRCCIDYNVGYSEDKRIFVPETNYCGRAERRTDEQT